MKLASIVFSVVLLPISEQGLFTNVRVDSFIKNCRNLICQSDCEFFVKCVDLVLPCGKKGWALQTGKKACTQLQKYYETFDSVGKEFVEEGFPRIMQAIFYKAVSQADGKDCKLYNELCKTVFQEALSNAGFFWVIWYNKHAPTVISGRDPKGFEVTGNHFDLKKILQKRFENITKLLNNKNTEF